MTTSLISVLGPRTGKQGGYSLRDNRGQETWCYTVLFSDNLASGADAILASGIPSWNAQIVSPIHGTLNLYVISKNPKQSSEDGRFWEVEVGFNTYDPTLQPPKPSGFSSGDKYGVSVSGGGQPIAETIATDFSSTPKVLCRTTNEPLDPLPTTLIYDRLVKIDFWSDKIDFTNIDSCIGKTNSASVTFTIGSVTQTFAANTFYFQNYGFDSHYDVDGNVSFHVNYECVYRSGNWQGKYPNISFYYGAGYSGYSGSAPGSSTHPLLPIMDGRSGTPQPIASPVYIDTSAGTPIASGGNAPLLTFDTIKAVSFSSLMTGVP